MGVGSDKKLSLIPAQNQNLKQKCMILGVDAL
jgi:hypothetical protein